MNDPGLDEPISNDAKDVENQERDEKEEKEEDEQAFLAPSRWWFASTAFPLIAGTFGPMASAFSICALVVHWRVYIPPGAAEENGVPIPDPKWLIGINAAQLALALISNLFLLLNMARRVRFSIAQPITIIGWYVSSFALIGLCACASGPLIIHPTSDHAFTQAYYYAIFSAGLYFLVATLMLVTVWGAYRGHYDKEFQLTMSQRTLMLQTISFLVYLLAGAAVYSHIEGWAYLDAVYWADFTLLTVGIGDYSPQTHLGRGLLFPFAIGGIIILGLVIGSIRSLVLERGKVKMGARMVEKERRRLLKKMRKSDESEILDPITSESSMSRSSTLKTPSDTLSERERRRQEFELMRKIQEDAQTKRRWTSLIISGSTWFVLWFAGAAIFQAAEYGQKWTYFGSLYFAYTSLLTIGYGDFYPQSNSGKPFFVVWSLLAIPSLTILISNMGDTIVKGIRDLTLWIGNFTVLPGEQGVKATLKESAKKLTRGRFFDDEIQEQPPGMLGESKRKGNETDEDGDEDHHPKNGPESAAQRVAGDNAKSETARAKKQGEGGDEIPKSKRHYHVVLIKEIGKVMKHLNSSPPRKYTFDEWAWYLKLIGEDENSADTHRAALRKPRPDGEGLGAALADQNKEVKWSWVGNRSPLMGNKEEAEWVLERLTTTLNRELEAMRREELEKEGGGGGETMTKDRPGDGEGPRSDEIHTVYGEKENKKP
ncbi:voltage-gated potassium channel [Hyaloscypha variabilis F]|uniref:Voltage-gated potassium channel n=1 Tax=Hyaloscypha variabilis (strain UAMH 11265 / GT02V1 / F) TaxID=1149755 RepID=A0A2J6RAQ0_HYAVF|nr:voltage-gated potassium channel [Hyaloscypha variabilis F]